MEKVAIVTGGEGGIGRAICAKLNVAGYFVLSADVAVAGPPQRSDRSARIHLDLASVDSVEQTIAFAAGLGEICAIVNCAGIIRECEAGDMPDHSVAVMLDINLLGAARMTAAATRWMSGGAIVNISSISSRLPELSNAVLYGASKSALETYTRAAARALAKKHIRVNAVAPGFIDVDMSEAMRTIAFSEGSPASRVAMERMGNAEEVAECVEFLLSERASYVTGATLVVDGGLVIH